MDRRQREMIERRRSKPSMAVTGSERTSAPGRLAATIGNHAFASATAIARQGVPNDDAPPLPPALKTVAETRIAPELDAVVTELRAAPPPTIEHLRKLRSRVAAVRALFDTVVPPAGNVADNWMNALAATAIGRTLLDGLLNPESDAFLRLAWGKSLGTCRQLVGLLEQSAPPAAAPDPAPAPSPNALPPPPPPPPPPLGTPPVIPVPAALAPADQMEFEVCPQIEAAIAAIPKMVASMTVEEIAGVRDQFADVPDRIIGIAGDVEFGPVAALEFIKGLELVHQATLAPPEQLAQIADSLETAAHIAADLRATHAPVDADAPPSLPPPDPSQLPPAPSPNPLPPPPPPPIR